MQKKIFLSITLLSLIALGIINLSLSKHTEEASSTLIETSVIINNLSNTSFHLQMIYGSMDLQTIKAYDVIPTELTLNQTLYTSFTKGFISSSLNETLLEHVNQFRYLHHLKPITYYYDFSETEQYYFISLSDGLDTLYRIDKQTYEVRTPYQNLSDEASHVMHQKQYVYHIQEDFNALYILAAESNSYTAYLYRLDKKTLELIDFQKITPSSLAVYPDHYALASNGMAFFIEEEGLQVESLDDSYHLTLPFSPTHIYFQEGQLYVLGVAEQVLNYVLLDHTLTVSKKGTLSLPNPNIHLLTTWLSDSILYTITYDPNHLLYGNYVTLYDLTTQKILYCMGLKRSIHLTLLDAHFINTSLVFQNKKE